MSTTTSTLLGGPSLPQERRLVTELPGPRSAEILARKAAAEHEEPLVQRDLGQYHPVSAGFVTHGRHQVQRGLHVGDQRFFRFHLRDDFSVSFQLFEIHRFSSRSFDRSISRRMSSGNSAVRWIRSPEIGCVSVSS